MISFTRSLASRGKYRHRINPFVYGNQLRQEGDDARRSKTKLRDIRRAQQPPTKPRSKADIRKGKNGKQKKF